MPEETARAATDREILAALVQAADEYGRDVPDHRCGRTDHEEEFWSAVYAARRHLRTTAEPVR